MRKKPRGRTAIGQVLMLVASDFQHRLDADLRARGVSGVNARHRAVILHLGRFGPSRAVDLAEAAGIRPQSMMKIVHEMESLGIVERTLDPDDSRAKRIDFTDKGRQFIVELSRSTETVWDAYADTLGQRRMQETFDNLEQLLKAGEHANE